ncbi:MAG: membrane integrity-associated transporter subunit PqiC [Verrucomicrobiales bacterium]|nr:membrane integrity-associated transporter subunit PqiC [Verrucomicrobiales bacterium]
MNSPIDRRWMLRLLALGSVGAMAGCKLQRAPLAQRVFRLRTPAATDLRGRHGTKGVLMVRPFQVAASMDSRSFLIRRGESEFAVDPYNGFLLSPGPMLTEVIADWVRSLGAYQIVSTGGSQVVPTHALEGELSEMWGDYRVVSSPKAVLTVTVRLLHPLTGVAPQVQWEQTERREVPIPKAGPDALVAGWNQALEQICQSMEGRWLRDIGDVTGSKA